MALARKITCEATGRRWKEGDKGRCVVRTTTQRPILCCEQFTGQMTLQRWKLVCSLEIAVNLLPTYCTARENESAR
jgi:hypothetical protein